MLTLIALVCLGAIRTLGGAVGFDEDGDANQATTALGPSDDSIDSSSDAVVRSAGGGGGSSGGSSGGAVTNRSGPVANEVAAALVGNTVADGSFEDGEERVVTTYSVGQDVLAWTVTQGNVDTHAVPYAGFGDGQRAVDLNGRVAGAVSQTMTVVPGANYTLSVQVAENVNCGPDVKSMVIEWNGEPVSNVRVDLPQGESREYQVQLPPSASDQGTLVMRSTTNEGPAGPRDLGPDDSRCGVQIDQPRLTIDRQS